MRTALLVSVVLTLSLAGTAEASDPTGIFALVERVSFEPSAENPERVVIHGAFSMTATRRGPHAAPKWGYLYFSLAKGDEKECRNAWKDLASVAGKQEIIGMGSRHNLNGVRLRAPRSRPENPTPFPLGRGVHKVRNADYGPPRLLRTLPKPFAPAAPGEALKPVGKKYQNVKLVVENALVKNEGTRYLFEMETRRGGLVSSGPIEPGEKVTEWKTLGYFEAGEIVTWRARVIRDDLDVVAVAVATFKVQADRE